MKKVIAIDLGASNGRLMLVKLADGQLTMEEIHRFGNQIIEEGEHLVWDIDFLLSEIKTGLSNYVSAYGSKVDGLGVDTWGVDVGLLATDGQLLGNPYCYRNTHTKEIMPEVHERVDSLELFQRTGVEPASINTIYQLYALMTYSPGLLEQTRAILTMPSLISYLLTGVVHNEFTHASTTQLLHWSTRDWDWELISRVFERELPLASLLETNTLVGPLTAELGKATGLDAAPVIAVPGHDTACALAAMPLASKDTVFMSCGTWVLIGVEVDEPVVTEQAFQWGFTNEGTVEQTYRLQKNNMGLWLLQQCRQEWADSGQAISYAEEEKLWQEAEPFRTLIDPDHELFFNPFSMLQAIQTMAKETNQPIPSTQGEVIRCILESLALKYRWVMERLEHLTHRQLSSIHMAGGGIQNRSLCQFTANATNKPVQAGPVEASALGNALSQLIALGEVSHLAEARQLSRASFQLVDYEPVDIDQWEQAYVRFSKYCEEMEVRS